MTLLEFHKKYCQFCGTQRCLGTPEEVFNCGNYNGEIKDIPKIKSGMDLIEELMKELNISWDDLRGYF